jgi:SAM-dependent methyltransferase
LRPSRADVAIYEAAVKEMRAPRALVLGVTPEIVGMQWPAGTDLLALDRSAGMIEHVWPRKGRVARSDWLKLALPDAARDIVIGDNPFTRHRYPEGHRAMLASIRRVLAPGGLLALRYFCRAEQDETPARVFGELRERKIGNFHIFKWRLAMALQPSVAEGVAWGQVWDAWNAEVRGPEALMRDLGWKPEVLRTIEVNRGSTDRVTFPTLSEIRKVLEESFTVLRSFVPSYEMGDRCPIVVARPR